MTSLSRSEKVTLIAVAAIILAGGVVGIFLGRADAPAEAAPVADSPARAVAMPSSAPSSNPPTPASTAVSAPAKPAVVMLADPELERLSLETMSGPPAVRVAAIERLATAPRDQALPLLRRVLLNGDPGVDRPAALASLRTLALAQGDGDERIRDAVREVIYHGDDQDFAASAQETLDAIGKSVPGGG
jgi:hypothetical protein